MGILLAPENGYVGITRFASEMVEVCPYEVLLPISIDAVQSRNVRASLFDVNGFTISIVQL